MKSVVVKDNHVALAFLPNADKKGDIHFGKEGELIVISKNVYDENGGLIGDCSNPSIVFDEGKVSVQYVNDKGKIKFKKIDPEIVYKALSKLLKDVMKPVVKPAKK